MTVVNLPIIIKTHNYDAVRRKSQHTLEIQPPNYRARVMLDSNGFQEWVGVHCSLCLEGYKIKRK